MNYTSVKVEGKVDNITHLYFKYPKASLKWTFQIYRTLIIWKLDFLKFIFHWRIIALQHCVCFCHTTTWIRPKYIYLCVYIYIYIPSFLNLPPTSSCTHPLDCHSAPRRAPLLYSNFPLAICFIYVLCRFPCYPLSLSHPLLPTLCPQVCSLALCFYSCPANSSISTIFLDSIYVW